MNYAEHAQRLRAEIARHNEAYFIHDAPAIPDADYDALVRELRELERDHPEIADRDSVTHKVGAPIATMFSPVVHAEPMLSLDNVFDEGELRAWGERVAKGLGLGSDELVFAVEPKIDGLALSILYVDGVAEAARSGSEWIGQQRTAATEELKLVAPDER